MATLTGAVFTGLWANNYWRLLKINAATGELLDRNRYRIISADSIRSSAIIWVQKYGGETAPELIEVQIQVIGDPAKPTQWIRLGEGHVVPEQRLKVGVRLIVTVDTYGFRSQDLIEAKGTYTAAEGAFIPTLAGSFGTLPLESSVPAPPSEPLAERPGIIELLTALDAQRAAVAQIKATGHLNQNLRDKVWDSMEALRPKVSGYKWVGRRASAKIQELLVTLSQMAKGAPKRGRDPEWLDRYTRSARPVVRQLRRMLSDANVFIPPW